MKLLYAIIFFIIANICVLSGCNSSNDEEVQQLYEAACNGDAEAQYVLGLCYAYGKGGIEQDKEEACKWIYKAAEQGWAEAQYTVSRFYETGKVFEKDLEKADYWRRKAIEQGLDVHPIGAHQAEEEKEYNQPEQKRRYNCPRCRDTKTCIDCYSGWVPTSSGKLVCPSCYGTVECLLCAPAKNITYRCDFCEGSGKCYCSRDYKKHINDPIKGMCPVCFRTVGREDNPCRDCNGRGEMYVHREAGMYWRP